MVRQGRMVDTKGIEPFAFSCSLLERPIHATPVSRTQRWQWAFISTPQFLLPYYLHYFAPPWGVPWCGVRDSNPQPHACKARALTSCANPAYCFLVATQKPYPYISSYIKPRTSRPNCRRRMEPVFFGNTNHFWSLRWDSNPHSSDY